MTKCLLLGACLLLLAFVACGGELASSSSGAPQGTVVGTVIDADGEPAANVRVAIGEAVATTDVDGKFALSADAPRYDVALSVRGTPHAYVFRSMTSRTPVLRAFDVALSLGSQTAHVHAKLPEPPSDKTKVVVVVESADGATRVVDVAPMAEHDGLDVAVRWIGPPKTNVNVIAIAYEADGETLAPSRYVGVARSDGVAIADAEPTPVALSLSPLAETTLRAHVTTPRGHTLEWATLFVRTGPNARRAKLADVLGRDPHVSFRVPDLPGATFEVEAVAYGEGENQASAATAARAGGGEVEIDLPRAPSLRAARGRSSDLSWDNGAARVSWVYFGPQDQTRRDDPQVWVATPEATTSLPDLHALGIALPRGRDAMWYVVGARGAKTVEEAAEQGLFADALGPGGSTRPSPLVN